MADGVLLAEVLGFDLMSDISYHIREGPLHLRNRLTPSQEEEGDDCQTEGEAGPVDEAIAAEDAPATVVTLTMGLRL